MAITRGLTEVDGFFKTSTRLIQADVNIDTICTIWGSGALAFYSIDIADAGEGILLNNGNYANPLLIGEEAMALPQLAPDLTFPSSLAPVKNYSSITGINGTAGLVTALQLTGKYSLSSLILLNYINEPMTVKLTVDGVIVWNDTFTTVNTGGQYLLGNTPTNSAANSYIESIQCESSLSLELETITANNITLNYLARPIL